MGLGYEQPMVSNELEAIQLERSLSKSNGPLTIFDVGANKGDYIQLIRSTLSHKEYSIYSFEPDPKNCVKIQSRFQNKLNLEVIQMGLGDRIESTKFYKHVQDDLSTLHYDSNSPSDYRSTAVERVFDINIITLDQFCIERNIKSIDYLKIDTEGHDYFVLKGAENLLKGKKIRNIQFEFSEMNIASKTRFFDFWNLLKENYRFFRICKDHNYEIKSYSPLLCEIYHPVNFFAQLKNDS